MALAFRRTECSAFIAAITECHAKNPYLKFFGVCNDQKTALNACLRKEVSRRLLLACRSCGSSLPHIVHQRVGRAVDNLEKAKAKRREVEEKWKAIEEEK